MTEQERLQYKGVMTESEKIMYEKLANDEMAAKLAKLPGMEEMIDFLCKEYAKAEYNYNQRIEKIPGAVEKAEIDVKIIRERIANLTMYLHGWSYAHEGGGWYELDYEQGDSMGWY